MFTKRVNELSELIGMSNTELAGFAGCDRSLISRIKSGERTPRPSSDSAARLVNGIFMCADDKNMTDVLCTAISCSGSNLSPHDIKRHILEYLYEGYEDVQMRENGIKTRRKSAVEKMRSAFGTRLDAVINIADISNVRLAKMLHIDASAISRFRNGLRVPKANKQLINDICTVLFERICELDHAREILKLIGLPETAYENNKECYEHFCEWMCDFKTEEDGYFIEDLLDNISSFSADVKIPLPEPDEAAPYDIIDDKAETYFGIDGIRTAVIRFLGNALKNGTKELWLYSDQNMDWMTHDMDFRLKWAALMTGCVRQGIKIRIIHNIDRDPDEMAAAINSWLPLYMSGMIESYYCRKNGGGKFSTTMFICPGKACISSMHVHGCEDIGIYRYDTDAEMLCVYEKYYKKLLGMSKPLVRIYREPEKAKQLKAGNMGITAILGTLSLATMPENVIKSIIERTDLSETERGNVLSEWMAKCGIFADEIKNGPVHECICIADEEAVSGGDVPVNLRTANVTYTPEEYRMHIKNVIAVSQNTPNYRFYVLPETPFTNIDIVICGNFVAAERRLPPMATFVFSHPEMCRAFLGYADRLKERYMQDKLTARRMLERYL